MPCQDCLNKCFIKEGVGRCKVYGFFVNLKVKWQVENCGMFVRTTPCGSCGRPICDAYVEVTKEEKLLVICWRCWSTLRIAPGYKLTKEDV